MRNPFGLIASLATSLATGLPANEIKRPQVTYVADAGFLLEHGGKKVLVDALTANADLLLVTHSDPKLLADYLRNNTRCRLIAHTQTVDRLRREEAFAQIRDRIREVTHHPANGSWTDPVSLGEPVNTNRQERIPRLSNDGKYLFFSRQTPDHDEDVYWADAATIPALRPGPPEAKPK